MSLAKRLAAMAAASAERIPADALATMKQGVDDLRASGILESMVQEGAKAPNFSLPSSDGRTISLDAELAKGPVILTYFRGAW